VSRNALLLVLSLVLTACPGNGAAQTALPTTRVQVGMHVVQAEVAATVEQKRVGLSHRPSLAEGRGLLFPYAAPERPLFWMKDMHFAIDIVWIREGRILAITEDLPHDEVPPATARPPSEVDAVLEVPAGTARRLGWLPGDTTSWSAPTPAS
jgi:uncharacterized membrane protein (UPF0127 family)